MTWRSRIFVASIALLSGCAAPLVLDFNQPQIYQQLGAANDVDESEKAWGVYASLAGNQYLFFDEKNHLHEAQFEWFIKGKVLKHTTVWVPSDPRMRYSSGYYLRGANPGEFVFIPPWGNAEPWRGQILTDGSVRFTYMRGNLPLEVTTSMPSRDQWEEVIVDQTKSTVVQKFSGSHRNSPQGQQILARLEQQERDKRQRSEERTQAFNSAMNGMSTALQSTSQAYAESTAHSSSGNTTSYASAGTTAKPSMPTKTQHFEHQCAYGSKISVDIPYKTEGCLTVKKEFTKTFACNDVDRMESAASACQSACGNRACDER
jgi:hypothetical protein